MFIKREKPRVVLDTNILISSVIGKLGYSAKILEKVFLEEIESITSEEILTELQDVFNLKEILERTNPEDTAFILKEFKNHSEIVSLTIKIKAVHADPSDDKFIETALAGKAGFIISGDHHLLDLKKFNQIQILQPKAFLEML